MAVLGLKLIPIQEWLGLDQFSDATELPPNAFNDSSNVVVTPNGNVVPLRSPANFNTALSTTNKVLSAWEYDRTAGAVIVFDINASSGSNVATYITTAGGVNTSIRTGQANAPFQSLNVNDCLYRVNGSEFIQVVTSLAVYAVGITAPSAAPTVTVTTGGSGVLTTGVYGSYAYMNTGTGHIGECSAASGLSGAGSGSVNFAVTASAQTGVNKIVVFLSEDGGTVRYLLVDSSGNTQTFNNTTGNITVSLANVYRDLNVEETAFNQPPPSGITFISTWKNRIMGILGRTIAYSGYDQISAGVSQEAWPELNVITIPNQSETAKGGIETQLGFLTLSDRNAYLISGTPTDKVDSGENTLQVTEQVTPLGWNIGTRSPLTIQNTPYGTIWLDQDKHLQLWPWEGAPIPIALGVWPDLATIQDTNVALAMAQGQWFPAGGSNGGFYVLTASTTGSTNNKCWFVMMIRRADGVKIVPCPSSIAAQCIFTARISGELRCFIGVTDRLREILDFDTAGAGWGATDEIYFKSVTGNQLSNFNRFHSLELNGTRPQDAIVRVSNLDGSMSETLRMFEQGGSYFGLVDRYQTRHQLEVRFPTDDAAKREVKNVRLAMSSKRRVI